MSLPQTITALLALLATSVHASPEDPTVPNCIQPSGRQNSIAYDLAQYRQVPDGRVLALCWSEGTGATIDSNWVTDLDAMLQRRVNGGACCIDCLPTAAKEGCTGKSKIWNIDNCNIGDGLEGIDQYTKDAFMDLIKELASKGQQINALDDWLSGISPTLTIDTPAGFREQEILIRGDGDTC